MGCVTSKAVVESKEAIWNYDPEDKGSIINGGLDVIAVIRTLAVKVCTYSAFFSREWCLSGVPGTASWI